MQTVRRELFNTTSSQLMDLLSPREQTYDEWLLCEVTTSCTHSDNGGLNSPKHQLQTPLRPVWSLLCENTSFVAGAVTLERPNDATINPAVH